MKICDWLKTLTTAPLDKLLLILGSFFVILSFNPVSYSNKQINFYLSPKPIWWLLIIGISMLSILYFRIYKQRPPVLSSTKPIKNGYRLKLSPTLTIDITSGLIQKTEIHPQHGAYLLPANTCFDDECIRDERSALGAFIKEYFPTGINEIQKMIGEKVSEISGVQPENLEECPPGTTLLLDRPLGRGFRILVTAVTRYTKDEGIRADTLSLIASIKSAFKNASSQGISELCMPVMGTGHGGLDFSAALSLIVLQGVHSIRYEGSHHIKHIRIVVYDPEGERQSQIKKVVNSFDQMYGR